MNGDLTGIKTARTVRESANVASQNELYVATRRTALPTISTDAQNVTPVEPRISIYPLYTLISGYWSQVRMKSTVSKSLEKAVTASWVTTVRSCTNTFAGVTRVTFLAPSSEDGVEDRSESEMNLDGYGIVENPY